MSRRQRRDGKSNAQQNTSPGSVQIKKPETKETPAVTEVKSEVEGVIPVVSEIKPIDLTSTASVATETQSVVSDIKPLRVESGDEQAEKKESSPETVKVVEAEIQKKVSGDEEADGEDLDEEDAEVAALLAGFENRKEARAERKRRRKENIQDKKESARAFFTTKPDFKALFTKKPDIREFLKQKIRDFKALKREADRNQELSANARIQIEQNKQRIRIVTIGVLAVLLIAGIGIYRQVRVFHHYSVISSQERSDDSATVYVTMDKYRLKCNPNGVACVNNKNEVIWNTTFTMQNLMIDKCGSLVAVAGQRGSEVYIFDENGLVGNFNVEHVLMKMKLTKQGDVAVILEDGQITWINIYDKNGTLLVKDKTTMAESGYPLDMDISSDGYKMIVSFLGVNEDIESRVVFYNFSAVGQDSENKLVNSETYSSHVIPEVKFMDGNYAIAFRDDGVTIFRGNQIPEECNSVEVQDEIISTFSDNTYFGLITESDESDDKENRHKYKMTIYRENGSKCGTAYFNFEYTNIAIENNRIVLYNSREMRIYDTAGKLKCSTGYQDGKVITSIVPGNTARKYTVMTEDSIDLIKIK